LQKPNHKALLAKEIFYYIKWWIIVLDASGCKSVYFNYQGCVYIPLSSRNLEPKFWIPAVFTELLKIKGDVKDPQRA